LKEIFSSEIIDWANEFTIDSINLNNVEVLREWKHIDIVIVHSDFVIAIENKVKSSEHSDQLSRYKQKIVEAFPNREKGFVYLTVDGLEPSEKEDQKDYISIGYDIIKSRIEIVLDVYNASCEIMQEHESIDLARELYKNHKEAIDFIIEHKPDRIAEIREITEDIIQQKGYVLQSCSKYYARFLTKALVPIIPKSGINGWKGNESFLFEIVYWEKGLNMKFVISPGNERNREILRKCMEQLPQSRKPKGKIWWVLYSDRKKVNFNNEKYEDKEEIVKLIEQFLDDSKNHIELAEKLMLESANQFE